MRERRRREGGEEKREEGAHAREGAAVCDTARANDVKEKEVSV